MRGRGCTGDRTERQSSDRVQAFVLVRHRWLRKLSYLVISATVLKSKSMGIERRMRGNS
jgi:hypothetical protein